MSGCSSNSFSNKAASSVKEEGFGLILTDVTLFTSRPPTFALSTSIVKSLPSTISV
jgi:hypothetical protein